MIRGGRVWEGSFSNNECYRNPSYLKPTSTDNKDLIKDS